jgi:hypothetical protein
VTAPNAELAYRVLDRIDADPKVWDQSVWSCGTTACFAGHAVLLSGGILDGSDVVDGPEDLVGHQVEQAAYRALGIDEDRAWLGDDRDWLFAQTNDRATLGRFVAEIFGPRPERAS